MRKNIRKHKSGLCTLRCVKPLCGARGADWVFNMLVSPGVLPQTLCSTNPHLHSEPPASTEQRRQEPKGLTGVFGVCWAEWKERDWRTGL